MIEGVLVLFSAHMAMAVLLFFLVNWIGEHAVDFGYVSTTLFEEPNESVALNFFIRALSPAVFIIALAASLVALGKPSLRMDLYLIAFYYYFLRAAIIILLNRHRLISWSRFLGHALVGIAAALLAHRYLIIPNRSLLPDLDTAGNELWLAILAFLYAVANKVPLPGGPGARRRNDFIGTHYERARRIFGPLVEDAFPNDLLKLITYAILVYEDYARPPAVRKLERWLFWKQPRTTGIMQVASDHALSDRESVILGLQIISAAWAECGSEEYLYSRIQCVIKCYNNDSDYMSRILEVMEILALRVDSRLEGAYKSIFAE